MRPRGGTVFGALKTRVPGVPIALTFSGDVTPAPHVTALCGAGRRQC